MSWNQGDEDQEYQLRSRIEDQAGDWSAVQRASIAAPAAVTNVVATIEGRDRMLITWDEPSGGPPKDYAIQVTDQDGEFQRTGVAGRYQRAYRMTHLDPDTAYTVQVRARSHSRLEGPAGSDYVQTPEEETVFGKEPWGLDVEVIDSTTIRLTWEEPEIWKSNITGYRIYRKAVSDRSDLGQYRHVIVSNTGTTDTSYTDVNAQTGVAYEYGIAVRRDGTSTPVGGTNTRAHARAW